MGGERGKTGGVRRRGERGRGGVGEGDSGQMIHCFCCGQGGHMANACNHLKVKDIPKNADGTWPRICHHCFKAGQVEKGEKGSHEITSFRDERDEHKERKRKKNKSD